MLYRPVQQVYTYQRYTGYWDKILASQHDNGLTQLFVNWHNQGLALPLGTCEVGGLTPIQALEIVRGCRGMSLVGADLVEVILITSISHHPL